MTTKAQRMISVAEDEANQKIIKGRNLRQPLLSTMTAEMLKHDSYAGKAEKDIYLESYGYSAEGLRAFLTPGKSEDGCTWAFCTERCKRFELEKARRKEAAGVHDFLHSNPAT